MKTSTCASAGRREARRLALYRVIFESDTRAGRIFDLVLVWLILGSVAAVMIDSFPNLHVRWGTTLGLLEWFFTLAFTLEYIARLACVQKPRRMRAVPWASSIWSPSCRPGPRCSCRACTR